MRDEDKPFVCTKNGMSFNIMPRNAAGWLWLAVWTAPMIVAGIAFAWLVEAAAGDSGDRILATAAFVVGMLAWGAIMVRWMYVRSEVIDVRKLLEEKRARDRRRRS